MNAQIAHDLHQFFFSISGFIAPFNKSKAIAELEAKTNDANVDMDADKTNTRITAETHLQCSCNHLRDNHTTASGILLSKQDG